MSIADSTGTTRPRRFTARVRLAFWYALLMIACGGVLLTLVALFIGFVPDYGFAPTSSYDPQDELVIAVDDPTVITGDVKIAVDSRGDFLALLLQVLAVALVVLAILSAVAAWWLAGRMLKPLTQISQAAKLAAAGNLSHRIGLRGPRDEITELAQTFDAMLDNIARSVAAQQRFAANASHELRTPLATNRAMLDVALAKPGAVDRDVLRRLQQVNERSIVTVEALLDLAELQAGAVQLEACDLAEIARTVLQEHQTDLDQAEVSTFTEWERAMAAGDARLYRQLVQNLVQNAIQHNVSNGRICVRTSTSADASEAVLVVENTGAVMSSELVAQLTEPFTTMKGRTGGGNRGLGLSIVSAIVERSQGLLALQPLEGGGLRVTVRLPAAERA